MQAAMFHGGKDIRVEEAAEKLVEMVSDHPPDPRWRERYDRVYRIYRALEERVAPLYPQVPAA